MLLVYETLKLVIRSLITWQVFDILVLDATLAGFSYSSFVGKVAQPLTTPLRPSFACLIIQLLECRFER